MSDRLRIASFNANSIRNRLQVILDWMDAQQADVVCVQETKVRDEEFPRDAILDAGYQVAFKGQKAFNGVAIISRHPMDNVAIGTGNPEWDEEARIIRATIKGVTVVNTYVPQGTSTDSPKFEYKLAWIMAMRDYFEQMFTPACPIVWVGDFNVAREPIDVYDPDGLLGSVCYNPLEHAALDYVKEWGFVDVFRQHHPGEANLYSFWDYRVPNAFKRRIGWRLDHIWATRPLADKCSNCWIDTEPRQKEKPSDHTFIVADFEMP
ncbi:MAG: exodeoxyribonuclease III [Armatimonadota bacterium]|nr:exodeoxyribonuclease III [bacterium]